MSKKKSVSIFGNRENIINNPDITVIGLTGPFGSGCTTFAKFFHRLKGERKKIDFVDYLSSQGYLSKERLKETDDEIYKFYNLLNELERKVVKDIEDVITEQEVKIIKDRVLNKLKTVKRLKGFIEKDLNKIVYWNKDVVMYIKGKIFSELKILLEKRETLNAFTGETSLMNGLLNINNPLKHHFRKISVSDIIVFKTILDLDRKTLFKNDKDKRDVQKYKKLIKKYKKSIEEMIEKNMGNSGTNSIRDYYEKWFSDACSLSDDKLRKTKKIMINIVLEVRKAKKDVGDNLREVYRRLMQDFGDNIRQNGNPYDYCTDYKKKNVIGDRLISRKEDSKYELMREVFKIIGLLRLKGNHSVFIIDALRNPYEVLFLREQLNNFYLVSIYADKRVRFDRRRKEFPAETKGKIDFDKNDLRDKGAYSKGAKALFGQNVTACSRLADISINNYISEDIDRGEKNVLKISKKKHEEASLRDFQRKIVRSLALIIDRGCTKPNDDESLMNQAYAMGMKSNCISRQVGAVVVDKDNYIIGAGWNDVGEGHISCGLIEVKDLKKGRFQEYIKFLDIEAKDICGKIKNIMGEEILDDYCICFRDLISLVKLEKKLEGKSNLKERLEKSLINVREIYQKQHENCRALHAEENAILQSARRGGMGLEGGKIYTTTFPCSLCAKKIMQVGIREIVFDDPYPAGLSEIFLKDGNRSVEWRHFEGVKPLGYFRLFKPDHDQKEWQDLELNNLIERYKYQK